MNCPDCDAEVVEVKRQRGHGLAEPAESGPWVLHCFDEGEPPWALIASKVQGGAAGADRYQVHRCSRRAQIKDDLATLAGLYGDRKASPQLSVPLNRLEGPDAVIAGDVLTLTDAAGNEVRAEVQRVEFVAIPRWDTYCERGTEGAE